MDFPCNFRGLSRTFSGFSLGLKNRFFYNFFYDEQIDFLSIQTRRPGPGLSAAGRAGLVGSWQSLYVETDFPFYGFLRRAMDRELLRCREPGIRSVIVSGISLRSANDEMEPFTESLYVARRGCSMQPSVDPQRFQGNRKDNNSRAGRKLDPAPVIL